MINAQVADAFDRIADLLEITGPSAADRFRINSYRRAARVIKSHTEDIAEAAANQTLTDLPGIGKGIAQKITQFVECGKIDLLEELESKLPPGLPALLAVQGLGPKKIAAAHAELDVGDLDDLKRVIDSGRLAELKGFGTQSVKKIAEGIAFLERSGGRTPMGIAKPIAETMAAALGKLRGVKRVTVAGSLRRGAETIGDVDLLCECSDGKRVVTSFVEQTDVRRVLAKGTTKGSITVELEKDRELQIDLRVVPAESFGAALQYFTGSKEHNVRLRELAGKKGWRLNEYGLFDGEKRIAGRTEESIYKKLGVPCVPPEIREDAGEFKLKEPPQLVALDDIRGDLHMHTTASDGKNTAEQMALAAKALGYEYIAVTDHSRSAAIANGLSIERMIEQIKHVRDADRRTKGIKIFVGCECDILPDGLLDYPDEVLAECDIVVASIHLAQGRSKPSPTERTIAAIENPHVTIIGHPTGRLLNRRPAMKLDMAEIVRAAVETDTALEINASWQRLDLNAQHVRQAIEAGVMLAIGTDAHHTDTLSTMTFGVTTARRGWARPENILNTKPLTQLRIWLKKKRT